MMNKYHICWDPLEVPNFIFIYCVLIYLDKPKPIALNIVHFLKATNHLVFRTLTTEYLIGKHIYDFHCVYVIDNVPQSWKVLQNVIHFKFRNGFQISYHIHGRTNLKN